MKYFKIVKYYIFLLLVLILVAGSYRYFKFFHADPKALGFSSSEEMQAFKARGYSSMYEYLEVKKREPAWYYENCELAGGGSFENFCLGQAISWRGVVKRVDKDDGIRISVRNEDGGELEKGFSVDALSLLGSVGSGDIGRLIDFDAIIGKKHVFTNDVDNARLVRLESPADYAARLISEQSLAAERDRRAAEQVAQAKAEADAELEKKSEDAAWLAERNELKAKNACTGPIENHAKNKFEWIETGLFDAPRNVFNAYLKKTPSPYVVTFLGDGIRFQNGFGAMIRMKYSCSYDTKNNVVVDVSVDERD